MDQLKSSDHKGDMKPDSKKYSADLVPKRTFTLELAVGVFTIIGVACLGYLAVGLGNMRIFSGSEYPVYAEFNDVSGLKAGATVEIAGVQIGTVTNLELKDPNSLVTLMITNSVQLRDDDIAMVRTKGIIGDRYIKISRGGNGEVIPAGGLITDTNGAMDVEDLIGKLVHSMTSESSSSSSASSAASE